MMKSFDIILAECLKNKGLKYIRFKVDPTLNSGFEKSESYEAGNIKEHKQWFLISRLFSI